MNNNRIPVSELLAIVGIVLLFTGLQVTYSLQYGRLSVPPVYDDIVYLRDGFSLLTSGYEHGWGRWLLDALTRTWHAPVAALQACIGLALAGRSIWGPYALNGVYLVVLLVALRREAGSLSRSPFFALVIALLAWPLTGFLISEFRPDLATGLFVALGGWRLARSYAAIGQGDVRSFARLWPIVWPFLFALWLKPSYVPVVVGYWLAAWFLVATVNRLLAPAENALRHTWSTFAMSSVLLLASFIPYLLISWRHLADYWQSSVFGANREIWSMSLSVLDQLKYYLVGDGGQATEKWWTPISGGVTVVAAFLALRRKDEQALVAGGLFLAFTTVAWAGLTILGNKSPWFGSLVSSHFLGLFAISTGYLVARAIVMGRARYALAALLLAAGVGLQTWPVDGALPNMSMDEIPAYAAEARRVNADVCRALRDATRRRKVTVLIPVISALVNPDLAELCEVESGGGGVSAPQIFTAPFADVMRAVRSYEKSPDPEVLALVLSEDFRSIPGYLPASRHVGSINQFFESSSYFALVATIDGPENSGQIRIFRKTGVFPAIYNAQGIRNPEGPYPEKGLPIVRWTLFPAASFDIAVTRGRRFALALAGSAAKPVIELDVRLSSGETTQCAFVADMVSECRLEFVANDDQVRVTLQFRNPDGSKIVTTSGSEAVLLSKIEVVDLDRGLEASSRDSRRASIAFHNIDFLQGFGDVEGPYPKWQLPVVVWGRGTESRFAIAGENLDQGMLVLEWRPGDDVMAINLAFGSKPLGQCAAGPPGDSFRRCEIALPHGNAASEVTLQYERAKDAPAAGTSTNSVLFKRIALTRHGG